MQDTARTFSGSASAKSKYEVYMEALHFSKIIERLRDAKERVSEMQDDLEAFQNMHQVIYLLIHYVICTDGCCNGGNQHPKRLKSEMFLRDILSLLLPTDLGMNFPS